MFEVDYTITCYEGETIEEKVRWICLEQSVELPEEVVPADILNKVAGKTLSISAEADNRFRVRIAWPLANAGGEPTQFLNILYGNISLKKGIRIESVNWQQLDGLLKGPAFGISGFRKLLRREPGALACAVLKPMGLSPEELAVRAAQFSAGRIPLIKDDHGLANQLYAPFGERVKAVVQALRKSERDHGIRSLYFPNISCSGSRIMQRYREAFEAGADGVMLIPELCGYEVMHELAQSDIPLPLIAHPALSGTYVSDKEHGYAPAFLYGELYRAFGADFVVYPNTGGRFSFTPQECSAINSRLRDESLPFKTSFPMPGGGMKRETLNRWIKEYGRDSVFLLGASLLQHPDGIKAAALEVSEVLQQN